MNAWILMRVLILLMVANGAPVIAKNFIGDRYTYPLDARFRLTDGQPVFGSSKTIRGLSIAIISTVAVAPLLGFDWTIGLIVGVAAMAGDLCSSFIKRRTKLAAGARATGVDQIPESLFPLLAVSGALSLTLTDIAVGVAIFFGGEILLSRVLFRFHLRDHPY